MNSILTVDTPATVTQLTTVERMVEELSETSTANFDLISAKIDEATSDIIKALGYDPRREGVTEVFWFDSGAARRVDSLILARQPIVSVSSVTLDGEAIGSSLYRVDKDAGIIYPLTSDGYPTYWEICKGLSISYTSGYLLPGEENRDLPAGIEGAAISLASSYYTSRGRDPLVRSESIPGVRDVTYWVGAVGEADQLPPDVQSKISRYCRPRRP